MSKLILLISTWIIATHFSGNDSSSLTRSASCNEPWYKLSECNFTAELQECSFIPLDSIDVRGILMDQDVLVQELSERESKLLGNYRSASGELFGVAFSAIRAIEYYELFQRLPQNGIELLQLYDTNLLTSNGWNNWLELSRDAQLDRVRRAINPTTGKVYSSFSNVEWTQYGVLLALKEGDEAVKAIPYHRIDSETGEQVIEWRPYQAWRVVIYGEKPGTTLIDKTIWREIGGDSSVGSPCKCRPKDD